MTAEQALPAVIGSDRWTGAGLTAERLHPHRPDDGVLLTDGRHGQVLGAEQARELAAWLLWAVGDTEHPVPADAVRAEIDMQRAALRARSATYVGEDFRAGLAWAEHALDAVARAGGAPDWRRA